MSASTRTDITARPVREFPGRPVRHTTPPPTAMPDSKQIEETIRTIDSIRVERDQLLGIKHENDSTITELEAQVDGLLLDKAQAERDRIASDTKIEMLEERIRIKEAQCIKLGHDIVALTTEFSTIRNAVDQGLRVVKSTIGMGKINASVQSDDDPAVQSLHKFGAESRVENGGSFDGSTLARR